MSDEELLEMAYTIMERIKLQRGISLDSYTGARLHEWLRRYKNRLTKRAADGGGFSPPIEFCLIPNFGCAFGVGQRPAPPPLTQTVDRKEIDMNDVSTIVVPPEVAEQKIGEYKTLLKTQRRAEDVEMRRMYKAAMKGKPIIDVFQAWQATGLKDGYPRLALAHANWAECHFNKWRKEFCDSARSLRGREHWIRIPDAAWNWNDVAARDAKTAVPFMPPSVRPKRFLSTYHILFEVENWTQYPADPFLLKHITGWLFVVEAEWELTELERRLLSGLR